MRPTAKNRHLRRADDSVESVDAIHAKIADGEGRTRDVGRTQTSRSGAFGHIVPLNGNLAQGGGVGIGNHCRHHGIFHGHGDAKVHLRLRRIP